ncbi:hypothetical protein [Microbaculum marinum]|uniref:RDD domain-containing protein n=1 Tax=Microbaculum marinum TaxID=1764581 RepID=A0AAW9RUM3_9HYPH
MTTSLQDSKSSSSDQAYAVEADTMLRFFLSKLDVRLHWLATGRVLSESDAKIHAEVKEGREKLLNVVSVTEDAAWTEAYRLERLLAMIEPPESLIETISERLDEAKGERVRTEPELRIAFATARAAALDDATPPSLKSGAEVPLRSLLLKILEEIHWSIQRKYYARPLIRDVTQRIVQMCIVSAILFLLPYILIYADAAIWGTPRVLTRLYSGVSLYAALTAGLFGAYFSRLQYVATRGDQMTIDELKTSRGYFSLLFRGCIGMCGALIVFFFLRSDMIDGRLFPEFEDAGFSQYKIDIIEPQSSAQQSPAGVGGRAGGTASGSAQAQTAEGGTSVPAEEEVGSSAAPDTHPSTIVPRINPSEDDYALTVIVPREALALLVFWCFLAGFSERLVPSILNSTENTLQSALRERSLSEPGK